MHRERDHCPTFFATPSLGLIPIKEIDTTGLKGRYTGTDLNRFEAKR